MDLPALIARNTRRLLGAFEPNPRHRGRKLAELMGIPRTMAYRYLKQVSTVKVLEQLAGILGVEASVLLDASPSEIEVVQARVEVDGARYDCVAWLGDKQIEPFAADTLLAWQDGHRWQIERFRKRREAGREVLRLEVIVELVADVETVVAVLSDDKRFLSALVADLDENGYAAVVHASAADLLADIGRHAPDVLILDTQDADGLAAQASAAAGDIVQTIVVTELERSANPVMGRFFVKKNAARILILLHELAPGRRA
ncbi:helix-turn-helix domain-containing protein [Chitinimonas koreensis]|uniref:helix-turn-helix domain-containing protein n=1 Tax=Chitinimonas koreensis TaxID=356302 RepID=UPI000A04B4C0|nr:helix-turn-helix domain-containing protein [Chitinimonas koreensis]QNM95455.1 hypothetical protein H9L41_16505 [Chitinimonas koreensis]